MSYSSVKADHLSFYEFLSDHYPKYVVTMDELAAGNINGVKIVHLADFLLSKDY